MVAEFITAPLKENKQTVSSIGDKVFCPTSVKCIHSASRGPRVWDSIRILFV